MPLRISCPIICQGILNKWLFICHLLRVLLFPIPPLHTRWQTIGKHSEALRLRAGGDACHGVGFDQRACDSFRLVAAWEFGVDGAQCPERARLVRCSCHIGSGTVPLYHPLTESLPGRMIRAGACGRRLRSQIQPPIDLRLALKGNVVARAVRQPDPLDAITDKAGDDDDARPPRCGHLDSRMRFQRLAQLACPPAQRSILEREALQTTTRVSISTTPRALVPFLPTASLDPLAIISRNPRIGPVVPSALPPCIQSKFSVPAWLAPHFSSQIRSLHTAKLWVFLCFDATVIDCGAFRGYIVHQNTEITHISRLARL